MVSCNLKGSIRALSAVQFISLFLCSLLLAGAVFGYFTIGRAAPESQAFIGINNSMSLFVWWLNVTGFGTLMVLLSLAPGIMLLRPTPERKERCSECDESCKLN